MDNRIDFLIFGLICCGLIFWTLFGGMYLYRFYEMDNQYLCGIGEDELCTEKTTNFYGVIAIIGFFYLIVGLILSFIYEDKCSLVGKVRKNE